jgi:pyruvate/2-oxoglutarate dehydrogenase complex dihydrolipoamide acyltransferase (E2) component
VIDHRREALRPGLVVELLGPRIGQAGQVARRLDHRHLHAQADAQIGHAAFAGEARGLDLALGATFAEAAGHEDRVEAFEMRRRVLASKISASIHSALTFTRFAMPPWVSASAMDL